jgi:hypothetical protein
MQANGIKIEITNLGVEVKERISNYLLEAGKGVAAVRILHDVLGIRSPDPRMSDTILAGFLNQDPRFALTEGLWHFRTPPHEPVQVDFSRTAVLHLQSSNRSGVRRILRGAIQWPEGRLQEFITPVQSRLLERIRSETEGCLSILWSRREVRLWNELLVSQGIQPLRGDTLFLKDLAVRVLKRTDPRLKPEDLASELGLSPADEERPRDVAGYLNACWLLLLERIPSKCRRNLTSLREWITAPSCAADFTRFGFGPEFLGQLPDTSGVYIIKDRLGEVIYIGKSRNLKRRVSSYFTPRALIRPKIARIQAQLHSIDVSETENEIEALLMETRLIKKFNPAINLQVEIHERRTAGRHERNLLLFVTDAAWKKVKVYFLRDGLFAGHYSARLGSPPAKRLREMIEVLYRNQRKRRKGKREPWEREIVSRWFAANRRRLNYLDIDDAGDFGAVLERLENYLRDPEKLAQKVYYR